MAQDPELEAHKEWLGYLQPVGLVVSPPALHAAGCHPDRSGAVARQQALLSLVRREKQPKGPDRVVLDNLDGFVTRVLGWEHADLVDDRDAIMAREVPLADYGETLSPTHLVWSSEDAEKKSPLLLIKVLDEGTELDDLAADEDERHWRASPQVRFERMLRENEVPIGLLFNRTALRLVYAPVGESSGHLTFPIDAMCTVAGRPLVAALHMLLSAERLLVLPREQRLAHILKESRRFQNQVSTRLAEQVLDALYELLRGFQAADAQANGAVLREVVADRPTDVYGGLLTSLLRLVFLLYAEDKGLLPASPVYADGYSVARLFERLREDAGRYPDTMDHRYGAWMQLLAVFRLIHDGGGHGGVRLPARHGRLFDPDAYPFLEGRSPGSVRDLSARLDGPRVSDGCIYRVLEKLLILDGERLSYRTLDVEQIGSVYESMMGFALQTAKAPSIAVRPHHVVVDLQGLLAAKAADRTKRLKEEAGCEVTGKALDAFKKATTIDEIITALDRKVSPRTPAILPKGSLFLQPTEERRRSGSHYTPRILTEPIVRKTLEPILASLGKHPRPEQILELKVCDPAMGSGAFLVEACRYLGDALVASWQNFGKPEIPPDEEPVVFARRLVAQRCLYGVDRNPFAVDLAKLSLWLATLAKDHPFTFLDHALRHGDSLVGLTREQIAAFDWAPKRQGDTIQQALKEPVRKAEEARRKIHALAASDDTAAKERLWIEARSALDGVRKIGDLVVAAFFAGNNPKEREAARKALGEKVRQAGGVIDKESTDFAADALDEEEFRGRIFSEKPLVPFHWELEFPEVFSKPRSGFDSFVGNPPFLGGKRISSELGSSFKEWLLSLHAESTGNADLVAHFFRRAFAMLREGGTFGLLATNTISQGDTRRSGLRVLCKSGGAVYCANRRIAWPGAAAVVVSSIHLKRGHLAPSDRALLDGRAVSRISAFLFHAGGDDDPFVLRENAGRSYIGCDLKGQGFLFDDEDPEASPLATMRDLVKRNRRNSERIFPYLGGEELNSSPTLEATRHAIYFADMKEDDVRASWPDLVQIVEKVKRERSASKSVEVAKWPWWQYWRPRRELYDAIDKLDRVLVNSLVSGHLSFAFQQPRQVFSHKLHVCGASSYSAFACLQSRVHEIWARFFSSSMKDDLNYSPSDCFETFPFPSDWLSNKSLERAGRDYYERRSKIMIERNEGLTQTYNRFHDPDEAGDDVLDLRGLHLAMDRVVLAAYGWDDLSPSCGFLLDYVEEEEGDDSARKRRKPWRHRWLDEFRDEVLARLLELNLQRATEEKMSSIPDAKPKTKRAKAAGHGSLFE